MAYKQLKLWFDGELAALLGNKIIEAGHSFDVAAFSTSIDEQVQPLELKDRVEVIADELNNFLGKGYLGNLEILLSILGPENEEETGMFANFYWVMPIAKFIEKYGLDHFEESMNAIKEITKRNTGEYTIRPYIEKYPEQTMEVMVEWSKDSNFHVCRLASEGGRPRLPWAPKLDQFIDDPTPLLPILENLKDDKKKYIQKSVANCLNDILKDNPEIAKAVIESWKTDATKERAWIIKHALRNLLKKEDAWALSIVK